MSDIRVTFACGHTLDLGANPSTSPRCLVCGEAQVARASARAPRFTGACTGPYATAKALDPAVVSVATAGPLSLKPQKE